MSFCTAINCMDGRTQIPVNNYLKNKYKVNYVDTITEPGPNKILAEGTDEALLNSILQRLKISIDKHQSVGIAIVGHHDCAGNPVGKTEQIEHIKIAIQKLKSQANNMEIIGLWVDEKWKVNEL